MIRLELDIARGRGRVPLACDRRADLEAALSSQRPRRLKGPVYVRLAASGARAEAGCGDAADFGRCILDTLTAHGLIDGLVRRPTVEWGADGKRAEDGPRCVVLVQPEVAA
jgi:hypothetical protein